MTVRSILTAILSLSVVATLAGCPEEGPTVEIVDGPACGPLQSVIWFADPSGLTPAVHVYASTEEDLCDLYAEYIEVTDAAAVAFWEGTHAAQDADDGRMACEAQQAYNAAVAEIEDALNPADSCNVWLGFLDPANEGAQTEFWAGIIVNEADAGTAAAGQLTGCEGLGDLDSWYEYAAEYNSLSWYPGQIWSSMAGHLTLADEGDDRYSVSVEDLALEHFVTHDTSTASFELLAEHCSL